MTDRIEVPFSSVKPIVQAAYPGAKSRRTVKVEVRSSYRVWNFWDGGSRTYSVFLRLKDLRSVSSEDMPKEARQTQANPFGLAIGKEEVALAPGFCVVEHVIFCGKDLGYRIVICPETLALNGNTEAASYSELELSELCANARKALPEKT